MAESKIDKKTLCEAVRKLCEEAGEEFLFIVGGKSCWSVRENEHIRKVANFHKETEDID